MYNSDQKGSPREASPKAGEAGQTLIELIVVISVSVIVIGALVFATIASLRNAQFSKNQSQATKLAQAGIETVRSFRDRNGSVDYNTGSSHTTHFNELWPISLSCPSNCRFHFNSTVTILIGGNDFETLATGFKRQILIEDNGPGSTDPKKVTAIVNWTDFAGTHESRLTTILGKL